MLSTYGHARRKAMGKPTLSMIIVLSMLLAGCSTLRVSHDYDTSIDFGKMKSYAWLNEIQPKTGDIRVDNELEDKRIRAAIDQALKIKGFRPAERTSADCLIAYQLGIQQKIKSDTVQTGVGFGMGRRGRYGSVGISTGTEVQTYDEGMLLIDVLAPDSEALLWRGKGTDTFPAHSDQQKRTEAINTAVVKILEGFPPQPK
jgi:hypothetical protein